MIERCNVKQIVIKGDRHNESHRSSSLEMMGISVVTGKQHKYWAKCDYKAAPRHQDNNLSSADLRVKEPRFCLRACMESFHEWIQIFEIISSVLCFCDKSTVFFLTLRYDLPKNSLHGFHDIFVQHGWHENIQIWNILSSAMLPRWSGLMSSSLR